MWTQDGSFTNKKAILKEKGRKMKNDKEIGKSEELATKDFIWLLVAALIVIFVVKMVWFGDKKPESKVVQKVEEINLVQAIKNITGPERTKIANELAPIITDEAEKNPELMKEFLNNSADIAAKKYAGLAAFIEEQKDKYKLASPALEPKKLSVPQIYPEKKADYIQDNPRPGIFCTIAAAVPIMPWPGACLEHWAA